MQTKHMYIQSALWHIGEDVCIGGPQSLGKCQCFTCRAVDALQTCCKDIFADQMCHIAIAVMLLSH